MPAELAQFRPGFTVLHAPDFQADPARHGTRTGTFIVLNFGKKLVLIGGTRYAGEMKKSIFTVAQLPAARAGRAADALLGQRGPGGRHRALLRPVGHRQDHALRRSRPASSSATTSTAGATAGSSTSRAAATPRSSGSGAETEPEIYAATQMFGTVLENVVLDPRHPRGGLRRRPTSPRTPAPATRSTTSRTTCRAAPAATRRTSSSSPPTPSACCRRSRGSPPSRRCTTSSRATPPRWRAPSAASPSRRPRSPPASARRSCRSTRACTPRCWASGSPGTARKVWLVNTGWTGGPYGVGTRMKLAVHPRDGARGARRRARRRHASRRSGVRVRGADRGARRARRCCSTPRGTWADPAAYDAQARKLADDVPGELRAVPARRSPRRSRSGTACDPGSAWRREVNGETSHADFEIIRDPLWDNIRLDRPALLALDTPAVQRLRYIRQLGHAFLVYPGATHTRFEHALGAYHLTKRALAALEERGELDPVPDGGLPGGAAGGAAARHRALPLLPRARGGGLSLARGARRRQAVPRRAGRPAGGDRRARVRGRGRRADRRREREPAAGADLRLARPRQDRLPEPRRADVRRALRHGGRGPAALHADPGRDRRRAGSRSACRRRA